MTGACSIRVRGVVQGVGFRPFVFRLAQENSLGGWVANGSEGVDIFLEGPAESLDSFVNVLRKEPPSAAQISTIEVTSSLPIGLVDFTIRGSQTGASPTTRISPDLPPCAACLAELADTSDPRFGYPYVNCADCGPRYSLILGLPYDRAKTTMKNWELDTFCRGQYENPADRRFHAQPVACAKCGPAYFLKSDGEILRGNEASIRRAAELLRAGKIVALKGLGGYHVACDAHNEAAVESLRARKFRKEKPFAVMAKDLATAHSLAEIDTEASVLLRSPARPITLVPAKAEIPGVAPGNKEIGIMLPYTPLHHLLFAAGAPDVLVMTSGNRSSEPIAYEDEDAEQRLAGIADAFLIGERPIARRVDDSVARAGVCGPSILRRSRGYAPLAVANLPAQRPILALGADLKNAITLVVDGQAFVSQHIGDLDHFQSFSAFRETIDDLLVMYGVAPETALVVHDAHPQYRSTQYAASLSCAEIVPVQHHRAHVASVLAERGEWHRKVLGVSFDGTGFGDDGNIWGGEVFSGSVAEGFERIAHLRRALLVGGDAAAQHPVQAAAGFLSQLDGLPDLQAEPFHFPARYARALELVKSNSRCFVTTSVGRLFDSVAALLGFTREITFEGQAAITVEQMAAQSGEVDAYEFPFSEAELDFRPALRQIVEARSQHRDICEIARAFHQGLAIGLANGLAELGEENGMDTVVASGGVFQNELLLRMVKAQLNVRGLQLWTNRQVPMNDGGISLGQATLAAFSGDEILLHDERPATAAHRS
ncbi:MAG TPA: carbamoyltransferase HypF [Candidatus Acidoferrum sp.]